MIRALGVLLALLLPCAALAQTTQITIVTPAPISGYGTLSVTTTSLALSAATVGPNSPAFPVASLPNRYIEVRDATGSTSPLYVCPLGGTCTVSVGIPLAVGETKTWFVPATSAGTFVSPTVITAGSATAIVSW